MPLVGAEEAMLLCPHAHDDDGLRWKEVCARSFATCDPMYADAMHITCPVALAYDIGLAVGILSRDVMPDIGDICGECNKFGPGSTVCDTFPDGIPPEILSKRRMAKEVD